MNTERREVRVRDLSVQVVRKDIKNLHLGVYPPNGRVRVAVPVAVSDEAVRRAVIAKLAWIRRQQSKFEGQARQSQREMVSGECHYFMGTRCRLQVVEGDAPRGVVLTRKTTLELHVQPHSTQVKRKQVLYEWYREALKPQVLALLEKWEPTLGVKASFWGVRRMRTCWGTCNRAALRIWLNIELAKKPPQCLEYILVHELLHLIDHTHGERHLSLMDKHIPKWRLYRAELNAAPLVHEE
jgi:predicted metal-dependent hydrolase